MTHTTPTDRSTAKCTATTTLKAAKEFILGGFIVHRQILSCKTLVSQR